ncbi:MAG: tRNA 2-thiouridine(34) synthase MnmA [Actinobacteria bacterium]|nr:MAG: tRNA 2-thiouridine(34) synthase MnmA [Actinomycetota bacterium]
MTPLEVIVAMSGGVDSSVAAAVLVEQGHEVTGVTLDIWPAPEHDDTADTAQGSISTSPSGRSCCGFTAARDASRVCHALGIPHYVLNFRDVFEKTVIDDFCHEYRRGRTPNPCIRCNQLVKFEALLERVKALGADLLATGHYARVVKEDDTFALLKGVDRSKDQSYALYTLTQDRLRLVRFPVGEMTKEQVRAKAAALGLRVAGKAESQEICFVPDGDYTGFVRRGCPAPRPGKIVDTTGREVGEHPGIECYTVGQRKGLGAALPGPRYVVRIEPETDVVVVGAEEELYSSELEAEEVTWTTPSPPPLPLAAKAKVRYNMEESAAVVTEPIEGRLLVRFERPQRAIAPGQAVVFYAGDRVLGGGTIAEARKG